MQAKNVFIHPTAEVHASAIIGEGTKIWNQAQIRENVKIGANCSIGKDVYIDHDVMIDDGVRIQNGVSVYKGVVLEKDVFVGPYVTFTNDLRPRAFSDDWEIIPTLLKRGCSVGANTTILCGVTLREYCMIAAGTTVTSDTLPYGLYLGSPARLKAFVSRKGFEMTQIESNESSLLFESKRTGEKLRINFEEL